MSIFNLEANSGVNHATDTRGNNAASTKSGIFAEILGNIQPPIGKSNTPIINDWGTTKPVEIPGSGSLEFLNQLWELVPTDGTINAASPEAFVRSITAPAERAANQLGTAPSVIIAVAALETGWGKHIVKSDNGESSNNLFGIKATGPGISTAAHALTSEFIDGVEHTLRQPFRTYQSTDASVTDFVDFLYSNPRYKQAMSAAHDADAFIEQVHLAGYATDPDYTAKVRSIRMRVEQILNTQAIRW